MNKIGYVDFEHKEAGIYLGGKWLDRYLFSSSQVGLIFRTRIKRRIEPLESFLLEGIEEDFLLRDKDRLEEVKSGQIIIVELVSDSYEKKLPLCSQMFMKQRSREELEELERLKHFDPTPMVLARSFHPLENWIKNYPDVLWLTDHEEKLKEYTKGLKLSIEEEELDLDRNELFSKERRRWLASVIESEYASISVEKTLALTAIDVNQGYRSLRGKKLEQINKINKDSIPLIVKALHLQKKKGIVCIDPISMPRKVGKEYLSILEKELKKYPMKYRLLGFTKAGLVELLLFR